MAEAPTLDNPRCAVRGERTQLRGGAWLPGKERAHPNG